MARKRKYARKKSGTSKRTVLLVVVAVLLVVGVLGINQIYRMYYRNICTGKSEPTMVYINNRMSVDELTAYMRSLGYTIESPYNFKLHARLLGFTHVMPGRYRVQPVEADLQFIRRFRNREQEPVRISFNNIRTKHQLAARLSKQLLIDSISIVSLLDNPDILAEYGFTSETILCMFIPDTYEVYWSIEARALLNRFYKEYKRFWTAERLQKAAEIDLSPVDVAILASIVEEETNNKAERPVVAGLYLNRLRIRMPLQADPTVKYAVGDFSVQRILNTHLQVDSPYNTYRHIGLPPGPIRIASPDAIDAVLDHTKHKYLYMCAKETFDGTHNFAMTLSEHNRNAARYRQELNKRNIRR